MEKFIFKYREPLWKWQSPLQTNYVRGLDSLNESTEKPLVWKRYIDDGTLWNLSIEDIYGFINQANRNHPTIIKILNKETIFLDTCVYKSD